MTYREALEIIEGQENADQSYAECKAEAGMGAVSMGWDGYDGMAVFSAENPRYVDPRLDEARRVAATAPVIYLVSPTYGGGTEVWGPRGRRIIGGEDCPF